MTELNFDKVKDDELEFTVDVKYETSMDFNKLINKPTYEGKTIEGDLTAEELGIPSLELVESLSAVVETLSDTVAQHKNEINANTTAIEDLNLAKADKTYVDDELESKGVELLNDVQTIIDYKINELDSRKQDNLVAGTNIKTINNQSLLGSGNIDIQGGGTIDTAMSDISKNAVQNKVIKSYIDGGLAGKQDELVSGTNIKTINNQSLLDSGNINIPIGVQMEVGFEKWYGTWRFQNVTYQVYTKTIFIDALPSTAGITTYDHGISNIKQILGVYGFGTNGFVLNAPRQVASDNIAIYQVSKSETNKTFSIEVGKNRSNMGAYVTLIYAKNN